VDNLHSETYVGTLSRLFSIDLCKRITGSLMCSPLLDIFLFFDVPGK